MERTEPNNDDDTPKTLFVINDCSSIPDSYYKLPVRFLAIGSPWPDKDFFAKALVKTKEQE